MGLAGEECASDKEATCPSYLERLNKCLCNECCPEVHFSLASAIAFGSGVPGCADATCAASSLSSKLNIQGLSLSDFTDPIRRQSVPAFQSMMMELLEINPSEVTMRVGQPEAAARPNSVEIDISLDCLTVELCTDIWSRQHGYICTGALAAHLTELFGTKCFMDPKEHECIPPPPPEITDDLDFDPPYARLRWSGYVGNSMCRPHVCPTVFASVSVAAAASAPVSCLRLPCLCHNRSRPPLPTASHSSLLPLLPLLLLAGACSLTGGCIEDCLKGGLQVFDPPRLVGANATDDDNYTSPFGIFIIPVLPFPASNDQCACQPMMGTTDSNNTQFYGVYGQGADAVPVEIFLKTNNKNTTDMVFSIEDCYYFYAIEDNQDRDGDGIPDFLGKGSTDTISLAAAAAVAGAVSAVVAGAVAASVGAAVGSTVVGSLTASVGGGVGGGAAAGAGAGAAGGALTPLIAQAQFMGIAGQIGGKGALPASASGLSSGIFRPFRP